MKYRKLFVVEDLPVFQNKMFHDRKSALACPKGDMTLVQDLETGLIFNATFDAGLLKYDENYQNEQACSGIFQCHLEDIKSIVDRNFLGKSLIEVGCGKGYFLEYLNKEGYKITGIDPAYEGENSKIIKTCFNAELGMSAEGIILRHVLEHISDPLSFLSAIANANKRQGQIYIEVPCFSWICRHRAWFDIYYEHVNYFCLDDFSRIFSNIVESGHVFGGQYLYVIADLASLRQPEFDLDDSFTFPVDFISDIHSLAARAKRKRNAVWGGASKGVIFALYIHRAGGSVDMVVDINPAKQGKFMAGCGLIISSPEEAIKTLQTGDDIFVMNSNYLHEVAALTNNQFNYIQVDNHGF